LGQIWQTQSPPSRVYKLEDIDKVVEMIESNIFIIKKKKDEIRKLAVQHLEEN